MDLALSSSVSLPRLVLFLATRSAISVLPSVVSEGSPGSFRSSAPFAEDLSVLVEDLILLLGGAFGSVELGVFLCFIATVSGAVDSPSSPEASRDDACSWSLLSGFFNEEVSVVLRFRLATLEPAEDGEDIKSYVRVALREWIRGIAV